MSSINIFEEQRILEEEMVFAGIQKFQKNTRDAKVKGRESTSMHGILLMKKTVGALSKAVETFIKESIEKPGKLKTAVPLVAMLDPEVASFIALRVLMDGISHSQKLVNISHQIGQAISDQVRFNVWRNTDKKTFKILADKLGKISASRHYRRYGLIRHATYKIGENTPIWTMGERNQVGQAMIDLIIRATGLVTLGSVKRGVGKKFNTYTLVPTEATLDWIQEIIEKGQMLSPNYLPMVTIPKKWTNPTNGGYLTVRLPFQKDSFKIKKSTGSYQMDDMEYRSTNALQETGWKVNSPVLETMVIADKRGIAIGSIPDSEKYPLPVSPVPRSVKKADMSDDQKLKFKNWKIKATQVYHENIRKTSQILQFKRTLNIANKFEPYDQIFFPYQADFRGRKYTVPSFLTPQGTEYAKSLLTFAKALPIETQEQADWLAIHGANCAGVDKVSFEERIQWISDNEENILKSAELGLDYDWWTKFDDAWLLYAFCLEWSGFKRKGFGYMSSLPIALDGSNNGLQHYSAMLRCPVGGKATNLTNEPIPQDIYQEVADVVLRECQKHSDADCPIAKKWIESKLINRKLTKRPVMVVPYGGTRFSCLHYVEEYVEDQLRKGASFPLLENESIAKYNNWLTSIVWSAISEVVISAREVMDWIRDVSKRLSKAGFPVVWWTPTGMYVHQHYKAFKWRRIETTIDGTLLRPVLRESDGDRIDRIRAVNGSAPNFVHSLDASALTLTIHKCLADNIDSFCMIHDSYGTHAHNSGKLATRLREAFVEIYTENDVLDDFRKAALEVLDDVPEPPKKGTLDLNQVLKSDYFFC